VGEDACSGLTILSDPWPIHDLITSTGVLFSTKKDTRPCRKPCIPPSGMLRRSHLSLFEDE